MEHTSLCGEAIGPRTCRSLVTMIPSRDGMFKCRTCHGVRLFLKYLGSNGKEYFQDGESRSALTELHSTGSGGLKISGTPLSNRASTPALSACDGFKLFTSQRPSV